MSSSAICLISASYSLLIRYQPIQNAVTSNQLRNFAEWMADSRDIRDMEAVSTADLLAYRQSIQHLAASSQNRYLAAIKSFFTWALDTGMIDKNPAAGLKLPKAVSNRAPVFITLDETQAFC